MKLQYQLSIIFAVLILSAGATMMIFTSEILRDRLEQNMFLREKMAVDVLEKRIAPYLAVSDYAAITGILFDERGLKKDMVEYIAVYERNGNLVSHTFLAGVPENVRFLDHGISEQFHISRQNVGGKTIIEIGKGVREGQFDIGSVHIGYKEEYIGNIVSGIVGTLVLFIIILIILTSFLGHFLSRFFVSPINQLVAGLEAVSSGNLSTRVNITTKDELEALANVFNKMTGDLEDSKKKIEAHHQELESKVEERTKDLNEKIAEMAQAKTAMLNMMEDTEELNRNLASAQEKLKKNVVELKKLDAEKDKFISIAAHELKTPMTAIHGFTQLLEDEKVVSDAQSRNKYLKIIEGEIERLARLVSEVLDLSRVDIGALKLAIEDADVPQIVSEVAESLAGKAKEKSLSLDIKMEPKLPTIQTDKEKLKEILINLVGNSIKYTQKGGGITVNVLRAGTDVKFSVADTGIGIPKKDFDKIFSRFYQVENPLTRVAGSSGLGLSICKEFVGALGGKIWFESTEGKGSTFYFTLPIKGRANKPNAP